jgi:hypothetical protein
VMFPLLQRHFLVGHVGNLFHISWWSERDRICPTFFRNLRIADDHVVDWVPHLMKLQNHKLRQNYWLSFREHISTYGRYQPMSTLLWMFPYLMLVHFTNDVDKKILSARRYSHVPALRLGINSLCSTLNNLFRSGRPPVRYGQDI